MNIINDLRAKLSERIHVVDIKQIIGCLQADHRNDELLELVFDNDADVAYRALWICSHLPDVEINSLPESVTIRLIDTLIDCRHNGMRRMMLNLIYRQPVCRQRQVELLDFCFDCALSYTEPSGIRTICLKLAYKLTDGIQELQNELYNILDFMNESDLSPSLCCVRKNILKAMASSKTYYSPIR